MKANGVSVIVLTWNGLALVKECFPQVVQAIKKWDVPYEIIIVDNGSQDETVSCIHKMWPDIRLICLEKNLGFSCANNRAAREVRYDTILFLNNDLVLDEDFIRPLLKRLEEKDVFAVAPKMLRWDRTTIDDGLRHGEYHSGLYSVHLETDPEKVDRAQYVTFFCGACFLCKRDLFFALGGFDEIYTPYAWEDLDLAYRAWKRGYKIIYEPQAVCYHKREATTRSLFSNFFFVTLMWRNKFFFMWKNITYKPYAWNHVTLLPWKLIKFLCNGRWRYVIGFFRALIHVPAIWRKRCAEKKFEKLNDYEVACQSFCDITVTESCETERSDI